MAVLPSALSILVPLPSLNSATMASSGVFLLKTTSPPGVFSFENHVTWSLTYRVWFSTTSSEPSSNLTLIFPTKPVVLLAVSVFLFGLLASSWKSSNVAPAKKLLTSSFFASSLAFTPSFQSSLSLTHFFITTGSNPPSSVTWSAFVLVFSNVNVASSDCKGFDLSYSPLSVTLAFTSVPPFIKLVGIVTTPSVPTLPAPDVIDQVPSSAFVAVVVFVLPSFPV